jgi:hypothetical protein
LLSCGWKQPFELSAFFEESYDVPLRKTTRSSPSLR